MTVLLSFGSSLLVLRPTSISHSWSSVVRRSDVARTDTTSLATLERIMNGSSRFGNLTGTPPPTCLIANTSRTRALVDAVVAGQHDVRAHVILNLGMPKVGSSTLNDFFKCAGLRSVHGQQGACMRDAAARGLPVVETCAHGATIQTQLDVNFPPNSCFFPQISLLDEIHAEHPDAVFVLIFRPLESWILSARHFFALAGRWIRCDLPGLPRGVGGDADDLRRWFCGHVLHVRQFVDMHPSHDLVELDLYNQSETSRVMARLFNASPSCWGHENKNPRLQANQTTQVAHTKRNMSR